MAPASRTLAAISGRSAPRNAALPPPELIASSAYGSQPPRKRVKKLKDDPPAPKTETVYSDDPAPASSGYFCPSIPKFSLERSFPSILSTRRLINSLEESAVAEGLRPLCQVFFSCLEQIITYMADLPYGVRYQPEYEVAHFAVTHAQTLLQAVFTPQVEAEETTPSDYVTTVKHVELVVSTLRTFMSAAERSFAASKPLPALPATDVEPKSLISFEEETESLLAVVEEVKKTEEVPACEDIAIASSNASQRKSQYGTIISKVVRRRTTAIDSLASQYQSSESTPTLVERKLEEDQNVSPESLATEPSLTEAKEKLADMPYLPRNSVICFLDDTSNLETDVEMPTSTGDALSVRLDHNGILKAASLTALVRILTSMKGVLDQDFTPTFFVCFRFFTTPGLFLAALIQRFDENPPVELTAGQLEIWVKSHINDQIRVGKTIYVWLDLYWKPDVDAEALPTLQQFAIDRLVKTIPQTLGDNILTALDRIGGTIPFCRRTRKAHDLMFIYAQGGRVVLPPHNCSIAIDDALQTTSQLLLFNHTPTGREEFARQITHRISDLFIQIDPEDAIKYWHLKEKNLTKAEAEAMEVARFLKIIIEFERALCSWVTFSVLDENTPAKRQVVLEFWLDISARCIGLRNYSGAYCILTGISNGAITRLKRTVLTVNTSSKVQFHVLQNLFANTDNYALYREVLSSIEPTVPMLSPLIRDVVSSLNVIPTSLGAAEDAEEKSLVNLTAYRVILKTVRAMESCLIPYEITKNDGFHLWLEKVLAAFPSELEAELNDKFYVQSKNLERKDQDLNHIEPWNFTVQGSLDGEFTLHALPPLPKTRKPKPRKNRATALFRMVR